MYYEIILQSCEVNNHVDLQNPSYYIALTHHVIICDA